MIAELTTYLKNSTTITDIVGQNITYKKPVQENQPENYLYYTTMDYKGETGYKVDVTFTMVCSDFSTIESLTQALRCLMRDRDKKVPDGLKTAIPKLWKINEQLKFDFDEELIRVLKYELHLNH